MEDVMIDLETLGRRAGCTILSIGAVGFNPKAPVVHSEDDIAIKKTLGPELYVIVNRADCRALGLHEDPATLSWWDKQSRAAKAVVEEATNGGFPLDEALDKLTTFLAQFDHKKVRVWGNGADFDNAILAHCYAAVGREPPWLFWNNRCFRTLKALYPRDKMVRTGTYHNALDDAKTQALHAAYLLE